MPSAARAMKSAPWPRWSPCTPLPWWALWSHARRVVLVAVAANSARDGYRRSGRYLYWRGYAYYGYGSGGDSYSDRNCDKPTVTAQTGAFWFARTTEEPDSPTALRLRMHRGGEARLPSALQ
jgi:hypothetical protein